MRAVILAGGKGSRLRPYTTVIPKPLLPLGDVPILEVVLTQLARAGVDHVVITLGHLRHLFAAMIGDGSRWGLRIEYLEEHEPLGTAGCLREVPREGGPLLVMNGDLLTNIDYRDVYLGHVASGAWATVAVHRREVLVDYGVIEIDADGRLGAYIEKPALPYWVSMGINVLSPEALSLIPPAGKFDMPDLILAVKSSGHAVRCHTTDCYWKDIGRFEDYQAASVDFDEQPSRFLEAHAKS